MPKIFKKFIVSLLTFLVVFTSSASLFGTALAAGEPTWYNPSFSSFYLKVYDTETSDPSEIFGERYTAAQIKWIIWSIGSEVINLAFFGHTEIVSCLMGSVSLGNCAPKLAEAIEDIENVINSFGPGGNDEGGSVIKSPSIANIVGTSPVSGVRYFSEMAKKINPVTDVNAQGFGYSAGNSVVSLWRISRNISYAFLVVVVIVLSFMIMFRVKISPQLVVSVQTVIPKIIGALILITFSYAIAGLIIDLMYVIIGLLAASISSSGLSTYSTVELFSRFTVGENIFTLLIKYMFLFVVAAFTTIGSVADPATIIGGILLFLFSLFAIIAIIFYIFKIVALLFKTFAQVVLAIVSGPFEILMGTVTQGSGFGVWLRKLISYLAVYPLVIILFYLAFFFLTQAFTIGALGEALSGLGGGTLLEWIPFHPTADIVQGNVWSPPLTAFSGASASGSLLWAILSFVIVSMIPKSAELIQSFISGKPFDYGNALGQAMEPIYGAGNAASAYQQNAWRNMSDDARRKGVPKAFNDIMNLLGAISNGKIKRQN